MYGRAAKESDEFAPSHANVLVEDQTYHRAASCVTAKNCRRGQRRVKLCRLTLSVECPLSLPITRKLPFRFRPDPASNRMSDFSATRPGNGRVENHPYRSPEPNDVMSAFGKMSGDLGRPTWAQSGQARFGRKRNGSFREIRSESGRSTATSVERQSSNSSRGRSGSAVASRRGLGTRRSVDWRLASIGPCLIDEDAVQAQSRIIQLGGRSCI